MTFLKVRQSFEKTRNGVNAAQLDFTYVVQERNYEGGKGGLIEFNRICREYFYAPFPDRSTLIGCLANLLKLEADFVGYNERR
jgi:hypothetical protein